MFLASCIWLILFQFFILLGSISSFQWTSFLVGPVRGKHHSISMRLCARRRTKTRRSLQCGKLRIVVSSIARPIWNPSENWGSLSWGKWSKATRALPRVHIFWSFFFDLEQSFPIYSALLEHDSSRWWCPSNLALIPAALSL